MPPKPTTTAAAAQPAAAAPLPMPQAGGSYTRQPDGSLAPTPAVAEQAQATNTTPTEE